MPKNCLKWHARLLYPLKEKIQWKVQPSSLIVTVLLLIANGFFVAAEFALVSGLTALHGFEKQPSCMLNVVHNVSTLSGLIMSELRGIPKINDKVIYEGWKFTVKSLESNRADKVWAIMLDESYETNNK